MKCPECNFSNPNETNFCGNCGTKLERVCPKCSSLNPLQFKFCGNCGHGLEPSALSPPNNHSGDDNLGKIQRYLPEGLTQKILAQKDKIEGERRQVTIMFCDLKGFTPLTEKIGPDRTFELMDQVFELLIRNVNDYQGTVNEFRGDGVQALFGAPIAIEEAPQRAIRSALAIQKEINQLNIENKSEIPPVFLRIGINTGPVVVGALGNDLRVQFTAMGDTINLASRMEALAEPGTVYVAEDTFKLTEDYFSFKALGAKSIKGKKDPLNVYRVIEPKTTLTRFEISTKRGLSPFIGRKLELELLFDAFERVKEGNGQAISIVSEAGTGKSRLLYEFRNSLVNEKVTYIEGKCLSYSSKIAYYPIITLLKSNFRIQEKDSDADIRQKVKKGLMALDETTPTTRSYILELLSVANSGVGYDQVSPEGRKERIIETLNKIVLKGSLKRNLIIAIEDLHWMDKSSEDVLKNILSSLPGSRVLLLLTYRPEFEQLWGTKSYHRTISLNRFTKRESRSLVNHILQSNETDSKIEALILTKTEGVPFFIEEFIKSLMDLNIITKEGDRYQLAGSSAEATIPNTIQEIIMARVDSLPESLKALLQTASVVEREFSLELIKEIVGSRKRELISSLNNLRESEFIFELGGSADKAYAFNHALTREVVYASILPKKKRQLSREIATAIEKIYKDKIGAYYGLLAKYYFDSQDYEKAGNYSKLAGKKAIVSASFTEAIEYGKIRLASLERLPVSVFVQKQIIDTRAVLSSLYMTLNYHVQAKDAVSPIVDLALQLNYKKRLPIIFNAIGMNYFVVEEDYKTALQYFDKAIKSAEEQGDFFSLWNATYYKGNCLAWLCEFNKCIELLKLDIKWSTAASHPFGIITSNATIALYGIFWGKIDLSMQAATKALSVAKDVKFQILQGIAYTGYGVACYSKGLFEEAKAALLKGFAFCKNSNQTVWGSSASFWLGNVFTEMAEYSKAEVYLKEGLSIFIKPGSLLPSWENLHRAMILRAKVLSGDTNIEIADVLNTLGSNRFNLVKGFRANVVGEILLNIENQPIPKAKRFIEKAIAVNTENGLVFNLGFDYLLYAKFFLSVGDQGKAEDSLAKAVKIFIDYNADGWVKKYSRGLASLS